MTSIDALRETVCRLNLELVRQGLVTLTWGNVSAIDEAREQIVIKPSGVSYDRMTADDMVVVDLDGNAIDGKYKPSSDTPTHVALYREFEQIRGIVHTHSRYATMFAQARREIPCFGTTHADHFYGPVPLTRPLTPEEVEAAYEHHTATVIIERFTQSDAPIDPVEVPAVLVAGHGPFTWGRSADEAVNGAVALESVAEMALGTLHLDSAAPPLESYILQKHYLRKHGPDAYYGQDSSSQ